MQKVGISSIGVVVDDGGTCRCRVELILVLGSGLARVPGVRKRCQLVLVLGLLSLCPGIQSGRDPSLMPLRQSNNSSQDSKGLDFKLCNSNCTSGTSLNRHLAKIVGVGLWWLLVVAGGWC